MDKVKFRTIFLSLFSIRRAFFFTSTRHNITLFCSYIISITVYDNRSRLRTCGPLLSYRQPWTWYVIDVTMRFRMFVVNCIDPLVQSIFTVNYALSDGVNGFLFYVSSECVSCFTVMIRKRSTVFVCHIG